MAIIDAAKYTIKLKCTDEEDVKEILKNLCESEEWNIIKKNKSGEKMVNIKPLVHKFEYEVDNSILSISDTYCLWKSR